MEKQWMTCQTCKRICVANEINICLDCQMGRGFHLSFTDINWSDILRSEDPDELIDFEQKVES